jgi:DNA-binding NarL/FixJ family response regulator
MAVTRSGCRVKFSSFFVLQPQETYDGTHSFPRQAEVLPLVVAGFTNKMIARELHIAEGTVKVHLAGAFGKLGVRNRALAAVRGASEGRTECARWPFSAATSSAITPPSSM